MMKTLFSCCIFFISSMLYAQDLTGKWTSYKKGVAESIVEIYEDHGAFFGKIIKVLNTPDGNTNPLCKKCKGELKNTPIVGLVIIRDMVKVGKIYSRGTILNPNNGKVYSLKLSFPENDPNTLIVKGSVGPISETQHWKRVSQ